MILDKLENLAQYQSLHPSFPIIIDFLQTHNLESLSTGKISLKEDDLYINVDENKKKTKKEALLEAHRKYIDIQIPIDNSECIGYSPMVNCHIIHTPYQKDKDYIFFKDKPQNYIYVQPGEFTIFFPSDGHAPAISENGLKKIVIKIRIQQ
jgi:YhcH/YjgK/YiaL family protein